ncbi:MAG: flagellar hook capping family protein [Micavibrio aeruginosavorus]|uniref:Basal-body rod modification protein FlgD n=1 Tax=Micavibrio aeruginosavorus TaxID=349221 RepID=A0A2W5N840_9BACT|nr:MAG: flagellar hook capping family protein [Micavibrio aeruginosavorus]
MATVDTVTTTGVASSAANTTNAQAQLSEDFSQFLTLLTTQLQNQDPLSPMDSTEFTNQLVQFSQVEQQINSNAKLDNLVALQLSSISTVALGYVGMDISYVSSDMNFDGTNPVEINFALGSEAVTSKINIYDEEGELVYSKDAPKNVGTNSYTWNGTDSNGNALPAGTYTVKIDALDKAGTAIDNSTVVSGHVKGIETQNGVVYVLVGDRAVPLASIVNATTPEQTAAETDTTTDATT